MKDLLIFPFSGNALEIIECLSKKYRLKGFIDDDPKKQKKRYKRFKIFPRSAIARYSKAYIIATPANPKTFKNMKKLIDSLNIAEKRFATLIHPNASISPQAKVGYNSVVLAGAVITSNAKIGNHCWIAPNAVIHHDVIIEDYCIIGSGCIIAGNTLIRENCYIGSGSTLINGIEIGKKSLIGMGTNVITSLSSFSKVAGNPARQI